MYRKESVVYLYYSLETCDLVENGWLSLSFGLQNVLNKNAYNLFYWIELILTICIKFFGIFGWNEAKNTGGSSVHQGG